MSKDKYLKFGGMKFTQQASNKEINSFVRELSGEQKQSLFQVAKELDEENLIELHNGEMNTIDNETLSDQETDY